MCQGHYRLRHANKPLRPLRPRKAAVAGAARRFGLVWSSSAYPEWLEAEARRRGVSPSEVIAELVEAAVDARR